MGGNKISVQYCTNPGIQRPSVLTDGLDPSFIPSAEGRKVRIAGKKPRIPGEARQDEMYFLEEMVNTQENPIHTYTHTHTHTHRAHVLKVWLPAMGHLESDRAF
jgi:hypothetical protein